jgi:hypothetical protein
MPWSIQRGADGEKQLRENRATIIFAITSGGAVPSSAIPVRLRKKCSTDRLRSAKPSGKRSKRRRRQIDARAACPQFNADEGRRNRPGRTQRVHAHLRLKKIKLRRRLCRIFRR